MTEALRVGVIGAGYFATFHHEAWSRLDGVVLSALCDRSTEALERATADYPFQARYTDPSAFFDAGPYDIVDIATPPVSHFDFIEAALGTARLVICQKPFCRDLAEARRAADLAKDAGIPLVVHENFRFQPWYERICDLLDTNDLGALYQATFRLRPGDGQGPEAYLNRQPYFQTMERFLVHETAIHWVDVFRYLFGEPASVFADLRRLNPKIAGEDAGFLVFAYKNGFRALFDGNRLADHQAQNRRLTMGEFHLEGERGGLRLDGDGRLFQRRHGENTERRLVCAFDGTRFGGDSVYRLQRHVLDHLREGAPLHNQAAAYLKNLWIEEALYRSAGERRWIDLAG